MLLFTFFMALGTALRTLSTSDPFFLLSCHAGLFLNALTTFIPLSFPPHIAALWFPEEERILATALPQACIMLGYGVASILGPIAVPFDHVERAENGTASLSLSQLEETKENIHRYMLWTAVLAAAYFLVVEKFHIIFICTLLNYFSTFRYWHTSLTALRLPHRLLTRILLAGERRKGNLDSDPCFRPGRPSFVMPGCRRPHSPSHSRRESSSDTS